MTAPPRHSRFTPQIPAHPHEARLDRPSSCIPLPVWDILGVGFFFWVSVYLFLFLRAFSARTEAADAR